LDKGQGPGGRQLAGELSVLAVGEIDQRLGHAPVVQVDRPDLFLVDAVIVDLARPQVAAHGVVANARQAMGQAAAGAARQEAQDQAGLLRRAAIMF